MGTIYRQTDRQISTFASPRLTLPRARRLSAEDRARAEVLVARDARKQEKRTDRVRVGAGARKLRPQSALKAA